MFKKFAILIFLATLSACFTTCNASVQYRIVDLGMLPGCTYGCTTGINDAGQVVGYCYDASWGAHAFLWQNGVMQSIGVGRVSAINNHSQVVGDTGLWQNGVVENLGMQFALAINGDGQVAGCDYSYHACLWRDGIIQDLGMLPGDTFSLAQGINDIGSVVGYSSNYSNDEHAFIWRNGEMQDIGKLPGFNGGRAFGINNSDQVVGYSGGPSSANAFLWQNGTMKNIGPGYALAINNGGVIAGFNTYSTGGKAFLWRNDIMQYLDAPSGSVSSQAHGINNNGLVSGLYYDSSNHYRPVLWIPVPEPSGLLALGVGLTSTIGFIRRRA